MLESFGNKNRFIQPLGVLLQPAAARFYLNHPPYHRGAVTPYSGVVKQVGFVIYVIGKPRPWFPVILSGYNLNTAWPQEVKFGLWLKLTKVFQKMQEKSTP